MSLAKRFYLLFFLTLGTLSLSYASFAYAPLPLEVSTAPKVKGSSISGPFAFLPSPPEAQEISATYAPDIVNISFVIPEKCNDMHSYYYETILKDNGWSSESTGHIGTDLLTTYSKGSLFLKINFFTENPQGNGDTCLVNLVGGVK